MKKGLFGLCVMFIFSLHAFSEEWGKVFEFSSFPVGNLVDSQLKVDESVKWAHLFDRCSIVEDATQGKVLRVRYPKGTYGPSDNGAQFVLQLPPATAYEMTYQVLFEKGFDFCRGGKLPGLTSGGAQFTGGHHPEDGEGWSARFMWRKGGAGVVYLYFVDMAGKYGDDLELGTFSFKPGTWHTIREQIRVNDPSGANGSLKAWVDGKLLLDRDDLRLRIGDQGLVDTFYFSTFHGGNTMDWSPSEDAFIRFSDVHIRTCSGLK